MTRFLARRLLNYLVLLVLASFLTFGLASVSFHPLDNLLQRNPRPPQSSIDAKSAELGLDEPIPIRYADWLSGAVRGDFGTTVAGQPVADQLWRRIGVSLRLVFIGSVIGAILGVVIGAWGAVRQYKLSDRVITVLSPADPEHADVRHRQPADPRRERDQFDVRRSNSSPTSARRRRRPQAAPGRNSSTASSIWCCRH